MITYNQNPETAAELAQMSREIARAAEEPAAREQAAKAAVKREKRSCALTPREESVLDCVSRGLANKEIAIVLGLSDSTVKVHVKAIMVKTGMRNRTALALHAWGIDPTSMSVGDHFSDR